MAKARMAKDGRDSLIVLIKTLHQALRVELDEALREIGHTLPQQAVLVTLLRLPQASNAELARAAFVSPQSMGELLSSLARAGAIVRSPDPENGRALRTTLTAAGMKAVAKAGAELAKVERRLTEALSEKEEQKLRELLGHCLAALTAR